MPIDRKVSSDGMFVHTTAYGTVTSRDLISNARAMLSDSRIQAGFRELFDATGVTKIGITKKDLDLVADMDSEHMEKTAGSKCAIVVADSEAFELGKYFEQISRSNYVNIIVFNNVATARTWLGVSNTIEA